MSKDKSLNWMQIKKDVLWPFGLSRGVLLVVAWFARYFPASQTHTLEVARRGFLYTPWRLLDVWGRWDTGWYFDIVEHGYRLADLSYQTQTNVSFMPLYPMLVKVVSSLLMIVVDSRVMILVGGIIVANISFLMALVVIFNLVGKVVGSRQISRDVIWFLVLFPSSFVFSSMYAESTYLFELGLFAWFLEKKRYVQAGLVGLLASATRPLGVLLALMMLVAAVEQKRLKKLTTLVGIGLIPLGLLSFNLFTYYSFGDFSASSASKAAWGLGYASVWQTIVNTPTKQIVGITSLDKFLAIAFLVLATRGVKLLPKLSWSMLVFTQLVPALMVGNLNSIMRYGMVAFPIFVTLALWLKDKSKIGLITRYLFFLIQVLLFVAWCRFYRVT